MRILDNSISIGLKQLLNSQIERFGKVEKLDFNSGKRQLELILDLRGEKDPVEVVITDFKLIKEAEKTFIQINKLHTSKVWVNILWTDWIRQYRFEVPQQYAAVVKFLL
ncbi:MAG TPA: hypothetical protein PLP19_18375 [bacterium]|nr:hypothetical protein [bacterium]HPN45464.1 hypothetical protein [bacterium]